MQVLRCCAPKTPLFNLQCLSTTTRLCNNSVFHPYLRPLWMGPVLLIIGAESSKYQYLVKVYFTYSCIYFQTTQCSTVYFKEDTKAITLKLQHNPCITTLCYTPDVKKPACDTTAHCALCLENLVTLLSLVTHSSLSFIIVNSSSGPLYPVWTLMFGRI